MYSTSSGIRRPPVLSCPLLRSPSCCYVSVWRRLLDSCRTLFYHNLTENKTQRTAIMGEKPCSFKIGWKNTTNLCKVCALSLFGFLVCLPCVVTGLFLCLVLVLPCSRHVLSYVCLFMPCALLLLSVSPPLTCSQSSPGLFVGLVFLLCPVNSPCLVHLCLIVCPALIVLTCPSLSVVCVYSPCSLVSCCIFVITCYLVCSL